MGEFKRSFLEGFNPFRWLAQIVVMYIGTWTVIVNLPDLDHRLSPWIAPLVTDHIPARFAAPYFVACVAVKLVQLSLKQNEAYEAWKHDQSSGP
jgi:hypothetical protein